MDQSQMFESKFLHLCSNPQRFVSKPWNFPTKKDAESGIYGWARGLVGPLLLDCFAPSTFTHKAGGMEIFFWKTSFLLVCGRSLIGIAGGFFQTSQTDSETQRTLGRLLVFCVFFVLKYFDFQGRMLRFCLEDFFYETLFQEFCCHILVGEVGWFSV